MNPRHTLASERARLRAAQDTEATLKAIICGQAQGTNDMARKASAAQLLFDSVDYARALGELRAAEAAVDHAQAAVDIANDELRRAELATRERLAEALMGKRADDAGADAAIDELHRQQLGYYDTRHPDGWRIDTDPIFPAGSNASGEYPR